LGVLVRNLRTMRVVYWVNVSECSGAASPGLFRRKSHVNGCCYVKFVKMREFLKIKLVLYVWTTMLCRIIVSMLQQTVDRCCYIYLIFCLFRSLILHVCISVHSLFHLSIHYFKTFFAVISTPIQPNNCLYLRLHVVMYLCSL